MSCTCACNYPYYYFNHLNYANNYLSFVAVPVCLLWILVLPALQIGQKKVYIQNALNRKADFKYLAEGFSNYGRSILLYILTGIFVILWSLLFIFPGFVKFLSYSLAPYILSENTDISAMEAIRMSKKMMMGHKLDLFVLYLSFFWWILLSFMTLGIANIYVGPYMEATFANFYLELKNSQKQN